MINFFEHLPGWLIGLAWRYPFLAAVVLLALASVVYVVVLKLFVVLEDARDIRNRKN